MGGEIAFKIINWPIAWPKILQMPQNVFTHLSAQAQKGGISMKKALLGICSPCTDKNILDESY